MFRNDTARKCVVRNELLGSGSFGAVYRGDWLKTTSGVPQKDVAIKVIPYAGEEVERLGRELYFLKKFDNPFVVKYYDSFLCDFELWIVMELCDAGSLLDIYRISEGNLNESELKATIACRYFQSIKFSIIITSIHLLVFLVYYTFINSEASIE
jgi:serine/threonine protein kinase